MRIPAGLLLTLLLPVTQGHAQDAAAFRGGWVATDGSGHTSIYLLVVRGAVVTGTVCSDCADPRDLRFIVDGRITGSDVQWRMVHPDGPQPTTVDEVRGELRDSQLFLTWHGTDHGEPYQRTATLRRPPPVVVPRPATPQDQVYVPPGAPEALTADSVAGLWLSGTGPRKQYFILRRWRDGLRGLVCGPCDNPATMAPLENFEIHGTDLRFDIVHEGDGEPAQRAPFSNIVHATLARHELHLKAVPSFAPDSRPFEMTLLGPVAAEPQ